MKRPYKVDSKRPLDYIKKINPYVDHIEQQNSDLLEALKGARDLIALCMDEVMCDEGLWDKVKKESDQAIINAEK